MKKLTILYAKYCRACDLVDASSSANTPSRHDPDPERIHGIPADEPLSAGPGESTSVISLVDTMSEVAVKHLDENDGEVAIRVAGREIYRSENTPIRIQESRVHRFEIMNTPPTYFIDLKASRAAHHYGSAACKGRVDIAYWSEAL